MKRSEIVSFRINFEEKKLLEDKKKQLRSKSSLGTLAKNLAISRTLPKNDNDVEFLSLFEKIMKQIQVLGGQIQDENSYQLVKNTYNFILEQYEETLKNTIEK